MRRAREARLHARHTTHMACLPPACLRHALSLRHAYANALAYAYALAHAYAHGTFMHATHCTPYALLTK